MKYPDITIQAILGYEWWQKATSKHVERGSLIWAFIPHVDQVPFTMTPIGRKEPRQHGAAHVQIEQLQIKAKKKYTDLPVAAMSLYNNELWAAYKAKARPCLVMSDPSRPVELPRKVLQQMAKRTTAPTILVAPYYGADQSGGRGGYREEMVERIRLAEYPQFVFDMLPFDSKTKDSILRLDHLQPVGFHHNSFELTGYQLSGNALKIMDDWLSWQLFGGVPNGSDISDYWELVSDLG